MSCKRLLVALALVLASCVPSWATGYTGNGGTARNATANPTIALSAFPCTTGNLIVVFVRWLDSGSSPSVSSMSDTAGNTYVKINAVQNNGTISNAELWYAKNITGNASNAVSITFPALSPALWATAEERSGLDTTSPLDQNTTGAGTTSATSGTITTTQATEDLVLGVTSNNFGNTWAATGFSLDLQDADTVSAILSQSVASIQTGVSYTINGSNGSSTTLLVATFKQAGAPPPSSLCTLSLLGVGKC